MTTPISLLKEWVSDIEKTESKEKAVLQKRQEFIQAINLLRTHGFHEY